MPRRKKQPNTPAQFLPPKAPAAKLFDVVIYEIETRRVERIVGEKMKRDTGVYFNAEKRLDTVMPRLNDHYNAAIVPTGLYAVGDILPPND